MLAFVYLILTPQRVGRFARIKAISHGQKRICSSHRHLLFASKHSFERIVDIDQRFLLRVLKLVFFDVIPYLSGHFATRDRLRSHNLG
jgi:hypothetical protein